MSDNLYDRISQVSIPTNYTQSDYLQEHPGLSLAIWVSTFLVFNLVGTAYILTTYGTLKYSSNGKKALPFRLIVLTLFMCVVMPLLLVSENPHMKGIKNYIEIAFGFDVSQILETAAVSIVVGLAGFLFFGFIFLCLRFLIKRTIQKKDIKLRESFNTSKVLTIVFSILSMVLIGFIENQFEPELLPVLSTVIGFLAVDFSSLSTLVAAGLIFAGPVAVTAVMWNRNHPRKQKSNWKGHTITTSVILITFLFVPAIWSAIVQTKQNIPISYVNEVQNRQAPKYAPIISAYMQENYDFKISDKEALTMAHGCNFMQREGYTVGYSHITQSCGLAFTKGDVYYTFQSTPNKEFLHKYSNGKYEDIKPRN